MNNCPKCGNPLQPGTVSCPICGTNINQAVGGVVTPNITPTQPVMPGVPVSPAINQPIFQPMSQPQMNQISQPNVAQGINTPMTPQTPQQPSIVTQPVQAPAATSQAVPTPATTLNNLNQPATPTPVASETKPTQQPVLQPQTTSQPAQASKPAEPAKPEPPKKVDKPKKEKTPKEKKPIDKKILIIGGAVTAVLIIIVVIVLVLNKGNNKDLSNNDNGTNNQVNAIRTSQVTNGGYSYELPNGWQSREINSQYYIYDNDENVLIGLESINSNIDLLSANSIKNDLADQDMKDLQVSDKTYSDNRKGFYVTAKLNDYNVEYNFIENDSNIIYIGVVYSSESAKNSLSQTVQNIIYNLKYVETINAIDSISMYHDAITSGRNIEFSYENKNSSSNSTNNSSNSSTNSSSSSNSSNYSNSYDNTSSNTSSSSSSSSSTSTYNDYSNNNYNDEVTTNDYDN